MRRTLAVLFTLGATWPAAALALPDRAPSAPGVTGDRCPCPPEFPTANELFRRLLADPRQVQTSARYRRGEGKNLGEVALGDTWGMRRWQAGPDGQLAVQWDVEGMAYSLFHVGGGVNQFETVDFFANIPVELRYRRFSARFTLFHESSHLGDDYIRETGETGRRFSVEGVRQVLSYEPDEHLRIYGGGSYLMHHIPAEYKAGIAQGGFELTSGDLRRSLPHARLYLAEDVQSRQALHWNVNSNAELGVAIGYDGTRRVLRIFVGHFEGHSEFAQFYARRVSANNIGAAFDF